MTRYEPSGVFIPSSHCVGKCYKSCNVLRVCADNSRGKNVCGRFVTKGRRAPTTAGVGQSTDSCRLWHEEQELKAGSVKREEALCASERGGARHCAPLETTKQLPVSKRALCDPPSSHWTLIGSDLPAWEECKSIKIWILIFFFSPAGPVCILVIKSKNDQI